MRRFLCVGVGWAVLLLTLLCCGGGSTGGGSVVQITLTPQTVTVLPNATQNFTAVVTGAINSNVDWTSTAGALSSNSGQTITFTAPATDGPVTITAQSAEDPTVFTSATVTVASQSGGLEGTLR